MENKNCTCTCENCLKIRQQKIIEDNDYDTSSVEAYLSFYEDDPELESFDDRYRGFWASDEEYARDLADNLGDCDDVPNYIVIDWEQTAVNVMADVFVENGYYFEG